MKLKENIYKLRTDNNLSQEQLAEKLSVSRRTVQNWETGKSVPNAETLFMMSKLFNISVDILIGGNDKRVSEEHLNGILPTKDMHTWEAYEKDLPVEYEQCTEEGKDIENYHDLFKAINAMPDSQYKKQMADILFNIILNAEQKSNYSYIEPSDYDGIQSLAVQYDFSVNAPTKESLYDKIKGAWYGRICGCLAGKPIECIRTEDLNMLLKSSENYPMHRYITSADITDELIKKSNFPLSKDRAWADKIACAPVDDDTNYTVLSSVIIDKYGKDFTPENVLEAWIAYQTKDAYCTAERAAFRNYFNGYLPPYSAIYKNPYREWIGAQIRVDYYGYISPADIKKAAKMAYNDACISHTKNGIYGAMFIAAMISAAFGTSNIKDIINAGLSQIPATSRLYARIKDVLDCYDSGKSQKDCRKMIHSLYDEHSSHGWCHTISNAMIVTMALLYNNSDYGASVCAAVQTGFDTDCNGATVGSIIGVMNGFKSLDEKWIKPINGKLETSIFGINTVTIEDMVNKTLSHIK